MLKALELVGFKSFADKTRFEFPQGITVVVGPNGSGKSNIVDAIKWVLGEQSVKSLRGKEMADVIFNGSGSRRPLNSAETTLTFDNTDNLLPIETPDVHVTRRVYRSGEGEYLINGQACRLRDIRDLFAGTGVSTQAYSIIEQGKVDVMLQASPRDRRLIFEEAAGISRFKAKKIEAIRRLDRVEQNLLRLSDIVDEVDSRLRVVRSQAAKARRYKEYSDCLQELRTQVGLTDWRRLTEELSGFESTLADLRREADELGTSAESAEVRSLELEQQVGDAEETIRRCERSIAENREKIATSEASIQHERTRRAELEGEIERHRNQVSALSSRSRDLDSQLSATSQDVSTAERRHRDVSQRVTTLERSLTELTSEFDRLRQENESRRASHLELLRAGNQLAGQITSLESKQQNATEAGDSCNRQIAELKTTRQQTVDKLGAFNDQNETARREHDECQKQWQTVRQRLNDSQKQLAAAQEQLASAREAFTGSSERASVLAELERRHEGLSSGVREVLQAARDKPGTPLAKVRGLVADVLDVPVKVAPLIDVALGAKAGYVVVDLTPEFQALLDSGEHKFSGRVGFVPLKAAGKTRANRNDLEGQPGVLGRADRFAETKSHYAELAERLLGDIWVVSNLANAIALAPAAPGQSFVTKAGEFLAADGTLCVGPRQSGTTGLISRKSELREIQSQLEQLQKDIQQQEGVVEQLTETVADAAAQVESLSERRQQLAQKLAEFRSEIAALSQRQQELDQRHATLAADADTFAKQLADAVRLLVTLASQHTENESQLSEVETLLDRDDHKLGEIEARRTQRASEATAARVELAKSEQQLDNLAALKRQFQQDHDERRRAIEESDEHLAQSLHRAQLAERKILQTESQVALLYLRKESLQGEAADLVESREQIRTQRGQLVVDLQQFRSRLRKVDELLHKQELAAGEVRHQRETLAQRMREDYEIELAEVEHEPTEEEQHEREAVEEEIAGLRRKLSNIGNVNLEALGELEDLETRHGDLSTQFEDLVAAKKTLEQIIDRINADSRRLFSETLETVRAHFQTLFRKLFGGGQADIIIGEDEVDILESGLEIMARPPGKEPRNISLLSGGEKTLTCVALLLAIFRSRPSPFCVLDEVDAALDEANIERFIGVLQEFLQWTQFIVVTHSKKTMTCAGTLYGVTMQESGISKRVSVRFDDVSETGEILRTADDTDADEDETQAA